METMAGRLLLWVVWNTFLALIPVGTAYFIRYVVSLSRARSSSALKLLALALGVIWLAFLPNTCYLLTEWRHFLSKVGYTNLWARWQIESAAATKMMMYTLFYLCYSGVGVITFALAVRPIAQTIKEAGVTPWVWGIGLFFLTSVGVYLGLVLRFNTWDLAVRPGEVWKAVFALRARPVLTSFVLAFAAFLWVVYWAADVWIDGLLMRFRRSAR